MPFPRSLTSCEGPPALQQQTQTRCLNHFSYEQLSETSGQMHDGSDNSVSPSSLADPLRPSPLDTSISGGWQGPPYYTSYSELQVPSTSGDSCSPHSVDSSASNFSQYQSPASPPIPAEHCPSQGVGTTAAHYQQPSMAMFNAFLNRSIPSSQGTAQLPYTPVPTAPSPVFYNVRPETPVPAITKKRKRKDPRQLKELNRVFARTKYPTTEVRRQLATDLGLSPRCVQVWLAHISLYAACIISDSELSVIFSGSRTKGKSVEADEIVRILQSLAINQVTASATLPSGTPPDVAHWLPGDWHPRGSPVL